MASRFTVFGANGFIGRHLTAYLNGRGHSVLALGRDDAIPAGKNLGHGIYCIGLTADFRKRPFETANAHVGMLSDILERQRFESFLYLSSTRVYAGTAIASEDAELKVQPANPDHLYNLTKLAGEALCLASGVAAGRVVRLSNVIGAGDARTNFLPSLIADARERGHVTLRTTPASSKDYVAVSDVVGAIEQVALGGRHRIYNVASGCNTSNATIAELIRSRLRAAVTFDEASDHVTFPQIQISRLVEEFGFAPARFEDAFAGACSLHEEAL